MRNNTFTKCFLTLVCLLILISGIYADDLEKTTYSIGILGVGISNDEDYSNGYYYGKIFEVEHILNNSLGVKITPIEFYWGIYNKSAFQLTFINVCLSYDFIRNDYVLLGPSLSVNTLGYDDLNLVNLSSSVQFSVRNAPYDSPIKYNYIFLEIGVKYYENTFSVYSNVGVDVMWFIAIIGDQYKDHENGRN